MVRRLKILTVLVFIAFLPAQSINVTLFPAQSSYNSGTDVSIQWTYSGIPSNSLVKITIWREGASRRLCLIQENVPINNGGTANKGTFIWHIPADAKCLPPGADPNDPSSWEDLTTSRLKIRVRWQRNPVWGESSLFNIIRSSTYISVNHVVGYPGGTTDHCVMGNECEISWTYSGFSNPSDQLNIYLMPQGSDTLICGTTATINSGSKRWIIDPANYKNIHDGSYYVVKLLHKPTNISATSPPFLITFPNLPDLYVDSITFNDAAAQRPDESHVIIVIKNGGKVASPACEGRFEITRPDGAKETITGNIPPIQPGQTFTHEADMYMGDGINTVSVTVDTAGSVTEISENNNTYTISHNFIYKGNPIIYEFYPSRTTVSPGQNVTLTWRVGHASSVRILPDNLKFLAPNPADIKEWSGSTVVNPTTTTIYTLQAILESTHEPHPRTTESSLTINVTGASGQPLPIRIMSSLNVIKIGQLIVFYWNGKSPALLKVHLGRKGSNFKRFIGTIKIKKGKFAVKIPPVKPGSGYYLLFEFRGKKKKFGYFRIVK